MTGAAPVLDPVEPAAPEGRFREVARDFVASPLAVVGLVMLVTALVLAVSAPLVMPQDPYDVFTVSVLNATLPPGSRSFDGTLTFPLGTDGFGRDIFSAIVYGFRISFGIGVLSGLIALAIGTTAGIVAAFRGGWVDEAIMRLVDFQLSLPTVLIALIFVAALGRGVDRILLALVIVQWAAFARVARAAALVEKGKDYVAAARLMGFGTARIVFRHMLPNCLPPLIVLAAIEIAHAIALEATLSFLGLGLPVTEPSLGLLVANGFNYILSGKYWISLYPGVALLLLVLAFNLVGDRLREVLNPRRGR